MKRSGFALLLFLIVAAIVSIAKLKITERSNLSFLNGSPSVRWEYAHIAMPGLSEPAANRFEGGITITLRSNGTGLLCVGEEQLPVRWGAKGNSILLKAPGIRTVGKMENELLILENVRDYRLEFQQK